MRATAVRETQPANRTNASPLTRPASPAAPAPRLKYDFKRIPVMPAAQAKLDIYAPEDASEHEAERVGNHLFDASPINASRPVSIQRKCSCGGTCAKCQSTEGVRDVLNSPGESLDPSTRSSMESRFGYDFSNVRVHSGPRAAASAKQLNAQAYTVGSQIVFGANRFAPDTREGQSLLAHELTHVVQQSRAPAPVIQRKMDQEEIERCLRYQRGAVEPCSRLSPEDLKHKIPAYDQKKHGTASPLFQPFLAIGAEPASPHARFRLYRAVICNLSPGDADLVRDNFIGRIGRMSEAFDKLSDEDRCDLITMLDARIAKGAPDEARRMAKQLKSELAFKERARQQREAEEKQRKKYQLSDEEQFARDQELFKKAGRTTWFDVVFSSASEHYRIQYAGQIKNPLLKFNAQVAERAATVSVAAAAAEPVMAPIRAIVRFFECLVGAIKGGSIRHLASRFGLKFAAAFAVSFGPGVIVGATQEIASIAKEIASIIAHPIKFVEDLWEFLKLLWAPNAEEIACAMGQDMGEGVTAKIDKLAEMGDVELAYNLGKIAGPLVLNTLIAILAPEIVGALASTRIGKKLLEILRAMRSELKFLDKWRKRGKGAVKAEHDVAIAVKAEHAVGDAAKYMAEHELGKIEAASDGMRHAKVGKEGHEVVEVLDAKSPTGIACELHSPTPHLKVPCPNGMGSREQQIEDFVAQKGVQTQKGPVPKVTEAEKVAVPNDPNLPPRHTDMADPNIVSEKQAGVRVGEDHHIATKYGKMGKWFEKFFKDLGMSIEGDANLILDFEEHGRLRGKYGYKEGGGKYVQSVKDIEYKKGGHHKEYHEWVQKHLKAAAPKGMPKADARKRVEKTLAELKKFILENPDILTYGPEIFVNSPKLKNWKVSFP